MTDQEHLYLNALKNVLENGDERPERTGVGTRSLFGMQMRFDLRNSLPLLTTKRIMIPAITSVRAVIISSFVLAVIFKVITDTL